MKVKVIYATEVGTTKYVSELIQKELETAGHQVELHQAEMFKEIPEIEGFDMILFGSPTYTNGLPQDNMIQLLSYFQPDLSAYKVAVFSLGDHSYDHFCGSAEVLEQWVKEHKGTLLVETLKIDGFPQDPTPIADWVKQLLSQK